MSNTVLLDSIRNFLDSCFKTTQSRSLKVNNVIKSGAKLFENESVGSYGTFNVKISNKTKYDTFYKVPWIVFLKEPNKAEKGIYPLILADVKGAMNNNGKLRVDVCYGISEKFAPSELWGSNVLSKPKTLYAEAFPNCRIHKTFYFENVDEFEIQKETIISAVSEVINEYNKLF